MGGTVSQRPEGSDGDLELSTDDAFEVLSNPRRRYTLHYILQSEGAGGADLGELSEQVAAWENRTSVGEIGAADRKRVYTSLQQFHLPKMDEKGVVDFDERAGEVQPTAAAENLTVYLEVVSGQDIPWSLYFVGLSGVCAAIVLGHVVGAPVFGTVSTMAWLAFIVAAYAVSSLAYAYDNRKHKIGSGGAPPELQYE